jgi:hypothetical protein
MQQAFGLAFEQALNRNARGQGDRLRDVGFAERLRSPVRAGVLRGKVQAPARHRLVQQVDRAVG